MVLCILLGSIMYILCCLAFIMGSDAVGQGLKEVDDFFMNIESFEVIEKAMK